MGNTDKYYYESCRVSSRLQEDRRHQANRRPTNRQNVQRIKGYTIIKKMLRPHKIKELSEKKLRI